MKRYDWIDVLKGIGILLVVGGHILLDNSFVKRSIYVFHMPLFFFIAGYLFNPSNIKEYFNKKFVHLLVPYLIFLSFFNIPSLIRIILKSNSMLNDLMQILKPMLIGGQALVDWTGVFWFPTCLFFTQMLVNILMVKYAPRTVLVVILGVMFFSYLRSYFFPHFWLALNMNVALAAAPYFYAGYWFKSHQINLNLKTVVCSTLFCLFIIVTLYLDIPTLHHVTQNFKAGDYGLPYYSFVSAIAFIVFLVWAAQVLDRFSLISKPLKSLGEMSMVIMYLHQPIQLSLKSLNNANHAYSISSPFSRFIITIILSVVAYFFISKLTFARVFLLGSYSDFVRVFASKISKPVDQKSSLI